MSIAQSSSLTPLPIRMPFPDSEIVRGGQFVTSWYRRVRRGQFRPTSLKTAANANENLWWKCVSNLQPMIQDQP